MIQRSVGYKRPGGGAGVAAWLENEAGNCVWGGGTYTARVGVPEIAGPRGLTQTPKPSLPRWLSTNLDGGRGDGSLPAFPWQVSPRGLGTNFSATVPLQTSSHFVSGDQKPQPSPPPNPPPTGARDSAAKALTLVQLCSA